ncbi:hypothetical protein CEUSTIGMA_g5876.t1 [Chlamydomonas eustigma]|uniref:Uncharacterized protein n=1 Tax=Chlamydomonas eustigma TaxID=1157962 RepID=A0A250X5S9_9CHLO|nr:hypothetical protein CEUSTIGMA_g5876.t1 [Chlamydomonas eustigma]|eukprot:GAX78435.1 hypothetical protein CEUSTIGMA_g5876.t1 [Chlamydomonas eustigma]
MQSVRGAQNDLFAAPVLFLAIILTMYATPFAAASVLPLGSLATYLKGSLSNVVLPGPIASVLDSYRAAASSAITTSSLSTANTLISQPNALDPFVVSEQIVNVTQAAIDAAVLNVISQALNTASGICYTVNGALGTAGAYLGFDPATFTLLTAPVSFKLAEYAFGQTLYNDFNSQVDGSDYIGLIMKYLTMYNSLKTELGQGNLSSELSSHIQQLQTVQQLLSSVVSRSTGA